MQWNASKSQYLLTLTVLSLFVLQGSPQNERVIRLLDPLAIPAEGNSGSAVISLPPPVQVSERRCDLVIAGGGVGGVAAALAAVQGGIHACVTEPTHWLGGQMTSQGVSALDENKWIETTGASATYQQLRSRIRSAYAPFLLPGKSAAQLNPGVCWVSNLCFEPKVGLAAIDAMLSPYRTTGKLTVLLRTVPVSATKSGGELQSIVVYNFDTRQFTRLTGRVFIDATEMGDLLPLAGAGFRTGAEARSETGEPDGPITANPNELQSFTYPFVLARAGKHIEGPSKPSNYANEQQQFTFTVLGIHKIPLTYGMFERLPGTPGSFWTYRRLVAREQFVPGKFDSDLSMINWEGNDVCDPGYLSADPFIAARSLQHGKQVALGFAWWLLHEAPRDSGEGVGFPNLLVRSDVLGSSDGLSQYPYIREGRRLIARRIIREQDVAEPWQPGARAAAFNDSVGIGYYPIDIHGCIAVGKKLPKSKPYQIPLSALVSLGVPNLLAGAKDLGTTHITNGAFRLHPTEWAIGEASGALAAWAILNRRTPAAIYKKPGALRHLQWKLIQAGQPLVWFDDVDLNNPRFEAIQFVSLIGLMPPQANSLHFRPKDALTATEAAHAFRALSEERKLTSFSHETAGYNGVISRGDFAQWLMTWFNP